MSKTLYATTRKSFTATDDRGRNYVIRTGTTVRIVSRSKDLVQVTDRLFGGATAKVDPFELNDIRSSP